MINENVEATKVKTNAKVIADMDEVQASLMKAKAEKRKAWIRHTPARAEKRKA